MKIRLSITYRTEWGQALAAVMTWHYSDGSQPPQAMPMTSDDGQTWTVTLEPRTGRSRRLMGCTYYYIVIDNRGLELRREAADRSHRLSTDHDYLLSDCWMEESDQTVVKTMQPNDDTRGQGEENQVALFQQTLLFRVDAPTLKPGEALGLLGSHPAFGAWHTGSYLRMEECGPQAWQLAVDAGHLAMPVEYKYVVVNRKTGDFIRWEDGYNRTTGPISPTDGEVLVLWGEPLRTPEPPFVRLQQLVDWAQEQGLRVVLMPNNQKGTSLTSQSSSLTSHHSPLTPTYIFDLDGTLLDTLKDLMLATNHALEAHGMPVRTLDEIRQMVGNGVRRLIERAVPEGATEQQTDEVYNTFASYYVQHAQDNTHPYPGIEDMLSRLAKSGCRMAVVSNKMRAATEQLVQRFFGQWIKVAVGEDEQHGIRRKPAPDMVDEALRLLGADKSNAFYVGDSDVDLLTARNSGLSCISVLWGFRSRKFLEEHGATVFARTPQEIVDELLNS